MLYVRSNRPVEPLTVGILRAIDLLTHDLAIPYFVVGAMARDIVLTHVHGIETEQQTRDVDFGFAVRDWNQFAQVKSGLIATGQFDQAAEPHKLRYHALPGTNGYPLDIIPFRGTEELGLIAWPPELAIKMNVVGYEDAFKAAVQVTIEPNFSVSVASLPGLALMKIFAWEDRGSASKKDARDLVLLMRCYQDLETNRLFRDEPDILDAVDHDHDRAGPRLLGRDVRRIASESTLRRALQLFDNAPRAERLMIHMASALSRSENNAEIAEQLLQEFKAGLTGA